METEKLNTNFSPAQAHVYELLMKGYRTKKIAQILFVTEKTIKWHLTMIYKKLNIRGRRDLNFKRGDL